MKKANIERQREYRERMRAKGFRQWVLWVTDQEREAIRRLLARMRKDQK